MQRLALRTLLALLLAATAAAQTSFTLDQKLFDTSHVAVTASTRSTGNPLLFATFFDARDDVAVASIRNISPFVTPILPIVSVFELVAGRWSQTAELETANQTITGISVGTDTIVVGSMYYTFNSLFNAGNASVIDRDASGAWLPPVTLTASTPSIFAEFGTPAATDGNLLAIAARRENGEAGAVYVFDRTAPGAGWTQRQRLTEPFPAGRLHFGRAVALSGNVLAVVSEDLSNASRLYVFEREGGTFALAATFQPTFPTGRDRDNLELCGTTLVWAHTADQNRVLVYERGSEGWSQTASLDDPLPGVFWGRTIALDGDLLAVGAYGGPSPRIGHVHVYERDLGGPGSWGLAFSAQSRRSEDEFSASLALAGSSLLVGAPRDDDLGVDVGAVHVYRADR